MPVSIEDDEDALTVNPEDLPPFSGPCPACPKCGLPRGKAVGTTVSYQQAADGREYVERRCGHCGYGWRERCADADQAPCAGCGGWNDSLLGGECQSCIRHNNWLSGPSTRIG